jgi:hypothetical protein
MVATFVQIVTLASDEVVEAGGDLSDAISAMVKTAEVRDKRLIATAEFDRAHEHAVVRLREFALAVRADMALPAPESRPDAPGSG